MPRRPHRPLVSADRSATPREDLGGLSPRQAREILDDPIDGTGPLQIAADLPASHFDVVPTLGLDNARRMLWLLDAEGPWQLDARGGLPRSVALSLLKTLEWWPGYVETVDVSKEELGGDDLSGVYGHRMNLQRAGLIRQAGSALHVTPDGMRLLDRARTCELAARTLGAMLKDEGYEAMDPAKGVDVNRGVRRRLKLLLWKLSRVHEGWWQVPDLVRELTTREIREETEDYQLEPDGVIEIIMSGMLLAPLADLGLLECDLDSYSTVPERYRRTPLFEQMLRWTLRS